MRWLTIAFLRLRSLFRKEKLESELHKEIQFHVDQQIAELRAAGLSAEEARRQAMRRMGGVAQVQEECREARGVSFFDSLAGDLRYAARGLLQRRAFTATAIISLALGIGANSAIFSLIDAVLLQSLPVKRPDRLITFAIQLPPNPPAQVFSYPLYLRMRGAAQGVSGMFATSRPDAYELSFSRDHDPLSRSRVLGVMVSGGYFPTLGLRPRAGRLLGPEDDQTVNGSPVAVISDGLWRSKFNRDPQAIGETFALNDRLFTIVGVAPPEFFGLTIEAGTDLWMPISMQPAVAPGQDLLNRDIGAWSVFARVEEGFTPEQVFASLSPTLEGRQAERLANADNEFLRRMLGSQRHLWQPAERGLETLRLKFSQPLLLLMAMVVLVLLIACANVASLLLVRGIERGREMAVRVSLGARRSRLIRQLLTESLLLASIGGALGLALAYPAARVLVALATQGVNASAVDVTPDARVLGFTLALSLLVGVLFGVGPALRATRTDLASPLKHQAQSIAGGLPGARWGGVLVAGQTALSVVLLVGAALFVRSLWNLDSIDMGFDAENVLVADVVTRGIGFDPPRGPTRNPEAEAKIHAFYRAMLDGLRTLPGVESASISQTALATRVRMLRCCLGSPDHAASAAEDRPIQIGIVGPDYMRTVGMDLLVGRDFSDTDGGNSSPVAILNDAAAQKYFEGENPVGRTVWFNGQPPMEVIGIVRTAKYNFVREEPNPLIFLPALQESSLVGTVVVRTRGAPEAMAVAVRRRLAEVTPELKVPTITTLERNVRGQTVNERLIARLATAFGLLALALAAVGLYGVVGAMVSRRTPEFGVRTAFGAQARDLAAMVLRKGLALVATGVAFGVVAAWAAGRLVESMLYEAQPDDPEAFAVAVTLMLAVALLALARPASRAAATRPIESLRQL